MVYILGIACDDFTAKVADDFEHLVVVVHSVLEIKRSVVIFFCISIAALLELDNLLHQRMRKMLL